ncbi:MAG: phospholipid/cholesterol/gamma-HCH transport system permease protein [Halioglobus sp.]|jgi:phospholipid/cholesterol/gamma-HCH transport system permease protein
MSATPPNFELLTDNEDHASLVLTGDWELGNRAAQFSQVRSQIYASAAHQLTVNGAALGQWDSSFMAFLLQCHNYCKTENIAFNTQNLPDGAMKLLAVATAVETHHRPRKPSQSWLKTLSPRKIFKDTIAHLSESVGFIGDVGVALGKMVVGKANTRMIDFKTFCFQAGPEAFSIIGLTSVLVGMILAYLGAVQLQQFGAEVYVADLVVIGTLREMGVLMTAIVMAGRTGAAYAAQLGTMQTNEEIDAITTMGISPIEFLVVPRMLALVVIMPLLTIYADLLGIVGGGIVAGGMGITPLQYINQGMTSISGTHIAVGLIKSVIFAMLIAIAGCRSGINSGRSSAAVGRAATQAVVTAIVYLIIADAAINIIFQQIGI